MDQTKIDRAPNLIITAASLIIVVAGLRYAKDIIVPFMISVFVAVISLPLQKWLVARKVPVSLAIFLTLTADVLVLVGFGFLVGGSLQGFANEVDDYQKRLDRLFQSLNPYLNRLEIDLSGQGLITYLKDNVLYIFKNALLQGYSIVSDFVLIFLTILFILFEASGFSAKLERAIGHPTNNTMRLDKIKKDIQQYLLVKTLVSLATGLLVGVSLALMGLDFPILWGLLAFLLNYIPSLGSIIASVPPILLAIIQFGYGRAIGVLAIFLVINVLVGNLIEPHLMGRRLGLSALVVFLSLVFWGWVWGPVGMILSVPLTMIIKIMLENTRDLKWIAVMLGSGKEQHPENE